MTLPYLTADQVIHIPVIDGLKLQIRCVALVKESKDAYRACRKYAEFWIRTPWGSEVLVCFTHARANEVHLRL